MLAIACTNLGPDFERPELDLPEDWFVESRASLVFADETRWWTALDAPVLDRLIERTLEQSYPLAIAGLKVLEARAQLGIAVGSQYPQGQRLNGAATALQASEAGANTAGGADLEYGQYDLSGTVIWEADFWGRFRRGVEAADAALAAEMATYDDVSVLLVAQVADTYVLLQTLEEQLAIARANEKIQRRSYEITKVNFDNGAESELDMQQALTLLRSTQATIPDLEIGVRQTRNALAFLASEDPGALDELLDEASGIPEPPEAVAIGLPADLLRRRPDVRQAEYLAAAQSARIGVSAANLYPSVVLAGTVGLSAGESTDTTRTGGDGVGELFATDALFYSAGPSISWNFLNYGRIKNDVRVQDARLQQLLVNFENVVLAATREVEDSVVEYYKRLEESEYLSAAVASAQRSSELSLLRYREGFSDYQRVLDAQQALVRQQQNLAANRGDTIRTYIDLHKALGGGWEALETPYVDEDTVLEMQERTDWGDYLTPASDNGAERP